MSFPSSSYSSHLKVPPIMAKEEELFGGLDQASKGQGRIYKRLNVQGEYTYFRATGLFSGLYHFLFSKRLDKSDLEKMSGKVMKWMKETDDFSSKIRVEATFDKIFKRIQKNEVFTVLQGNEADHLFFQADHLNLFQQIAEKINAREKTPSETGQKSEVLSLEEIAFCHQLSKREGFRNYPTLRQAIDKLKSDTHPVNLALQALLPAKDSYTFLDIKSLKEKAQASNLSEGELKSILLAKAKLAELRNRCGSYLDIESFRSSFQGLDQLFELSKIESTQISAALSNRSVIEMLILESGWVVACASEELQNDPQLLQRAINKASDLQKFAMSKAKTSAAVAKMLVEKYPLNKELLKELVQWHGSVFRYASVIFQTDKSIAKLAIAQDISVFPHLYLLVKKDPEILQFATQKYPDNIPLFRFAVQQDGLLLQNGSEAIRSHPDIITSAVAQNLAALQFVQEDIKREMMVELIEQVFSEHSGIFSLPTAVQELILQEILKTRSHHVDAKQKTTLWVLTERIAQNYLMAGEGAKAMELRMKTAQALAPASPLADIHLQLVHADPRLGLRVSPVDTSFLKHQTLAVQHRTFLDGTSQLHLEAKLSHHTRQDLQSTLDFAENYPTQLFDALPKGFCKAVHVTEEDDVYYGRTEKNGLRFAGDFSTDVSIAGFAVKNKDCPSASRVKVIHFEGVGKVKIGNSQNYLGVYNRISIDLDPGISEGEAAAKLNVLFAAIGLGPVNSSSRESDIERIKVLQLFRAFYPQEAYHFERNPLTFEDSIEGLKAKIASEVPDMQAKFKYYFEEHPDFIYQQEVYPGHSVWAIKGLADEVKKKGAIGLMAGVTADTFADAATRFASILKSGALSSQDRFQVGIITAGVSSGEDIQFGGAESVFARLIIRNMPQKPSKYPLHGKMQIIYDLNLVERVGYAYPKDRYGAKVDTIYDQRSDIISMTEQLAKSPGSEKLSNEICIRNRISPQFIKGVLVANQTEKDELIMTLRAQGLITQNSANQDFINGISIDQFIHIGEFKKEYWA